MQKIFIIGNLTRDPEVRTTSSGAQILQFSVAVNDRRKNPKTDKWEDYTNFIDCTVFGGANSGRVTYLTDNLTKGTKVLIEGKLRWSQWESKGSMRSKVEVVAEEVEFAKDTRREEPVEELADEELPF